ncbi:uncharacterized protein [Notamacropus eugenii]|uniref:uncharacterized protein isoform X2 n=1 Tax=Notamacropus eugenii TaxID=9315 RepID=UPI003B677C1E
MAAKPGPECAAGRGRGRAGPGWAAAAGPRLGSCSSARASAAADRAPPPPAKWRPEPAPGPMASPPSARGHAPGRPRPRALLLRLRSIRYSEATPRRRPRGFSLYAAPWPRPEPSSRGSAPHFPSGPRGNAPQRPRPDTCSEGSAPLHLRLRGPAPAPLQALSSVGGRAPLTSSYGLLPRTLPESRYLSRPVLLLPGPFPDYFLKRPSYSVGVTSL